MTQGAIAATHSEREELVRMLENSRERFLAAIAGVDEDDCKRCPAEGKWSVLEIAEHVVKAEEGMLYLWLHLAKEGTSPRELDGKVSETVLDRLNKRQAPEIIRPTNRHSSLQEARAAFIAARQQTIETVRATAPSELRSKVVPHPFTMMDGYQLFLVMALHPERHAAQVVDVKNWLRELK